MKIIKRIITTIIITIIILIVVIIGIINKNKKENLYEHSSYKNNGDQSGINYEIQEVSNPTLYYTVYNCFQNFVKYISMSIEENTENDYIEGGEISYSTLTGIYSENEKKEAIYNLLDTKYIKDNHININNLYDYIALLEKDTFKINKMYTQDAEIMKQYLVYVTLNNDSEEKCFLITLDTNSMNYMIKPEKYIEKENINKEIFNSNITEIKSNKNNSFKYNRVTDEDMAKKYFYNYKNYMFENIEDSYNKLEKKYREKRFGSIEEYVKYINNNKKDLENIKIIKYLVNSNENYTEYVCKDQYENTYIFDVTAVMNYSLKLDNYTIETDNFINTYKSSTDTDKVLMNIDKWRQMLNNRDYKAAYNVLDETFRCNNFGSEENFEKYMKDNLSLHYKVEYGEVSVHSGLYIQKIIFKDIVDENSNNVEKTIIMKLNEGTDFDMSFNIE